MTARLRAAYSAASDLRKKPPGMLNVGILDSDDDDWLPATPLVVILSVVSGRARLLTTIRPTTSALLAVSAGAATGEQLARMAVRISAACNHLVGTIVADPDAADYTTGRLSRSEWPTDRLVPNGQVAMTTEIRH